MARHGKTSVALFRLKGHGNSAPAHSGGAYCMLPNKGPPLAAAQPNQPRALAFASKRLGRFANRKSACSASISRA